MTMRASSVRPYEASDLVLRSALDPLTKLTHWELYAPGTDEDSIDEGSASWLIAGSGEPTLDDYQAAYRDWLIKRARSWP